MSQKPEWPMISRCHWRIIFKQLNNNNNNKWYNDFHLSLYKSLKTCSTGNNNVWCKFWCICINQHPSSITFKTHCADQTVVNKPMKHGEQVILAFTSQSRVMGPISLMVLHIGHIWAISHPLKPQWKLIYAQSLKNHLIQRT